MKNRPVTVTMVKDSNAPSIFLREPLTVSDHVDCIVTVDSFRNLDQPK